MEEFRTALRTAIREDITREKELETTRLCLDLLGCPQKHLLMRPPYSQYDKRLVSYAEHTDRKVILWSIDSGDWRGLPAEAIIQNVLPKVHNGSIIIFHDSDEKDQANRQPTIDALKTILPVLKYRGYKMVTIDAVMVANPH